MPDVLELRAGSDPRVGDTDGDGLTDRFEILAAMLDHHPRKADTDGDGRATPQRTSTSDGLAAAGEQLAASNPLEPDTDGDDLRDGAEVHTHGTSATKADTDGDGARRRRRAACRHRSARPRTPTTTASSTAGPTTATHRGGDVSVAAHGRRRSLRRPRDHEPRPATDSCSGAPGQAGRPTTSRSREGASAASRAPRSRSVYDPARAGGDEADLRLFWLDEETGFWQPAAAAQARRRRREHGHGHGRALLDLRDLQRQELERDADRAGRDVRGGRRRGGDDEVVFVDVAFVLDSSGSMGSNDPQGFRRTAASSSSTRCCRRIAARSSTSTRSPGSSRA